jgi:hypothetical protein
MWSPAAPEQEEDRLPAVLARHAGAPSSTPSARDAAQGRQVVLAVGVEAGPGSAISADWMR